ncbi:S8 family serine peptidase [Rhodothermus profundi]|uniref:Por secretion system C-terminal sorting domain-containing protein n=1 Tax=Rhodothermus profundi TaxID=633813 RepID=A0A1M6S0C8_9BACT|nr:S8 family serine peptidase [Rhodothermus profundi]SHK38171.1 Por secretion system C-terminal sorting domain-containing protein [Rhodothermus profundi]
MRPVLRHAIFVGLLFPFMFVLSAQADRNPRVRVQPGVVVVKLERPATLQAGKTGWPYLDRTLARFAPLALEPAFPFLEQTAGKRLPPALERLRTIYLLRYARAISPWRVAAELSRTPGVVYAEPLLIRQIVAVPNDSLYPLMTHLPQIHAPDAWDVVKGEQGDVVIAIVDGGTDWRHPDLIDNVWTNPGEIPDNGVDDDGNGFVDDVHGWNFANNTPDPTGLPATPNNAAHGTQVAGVAAAVTNNNRGVAGSSWNARFMPINASCPNQDRSICFGYQGIVYAALNGAQVINASWGGPGLSRFEAEVIEAVTDLGSLIVAAAGNDSSDNDRVPFSPASHPRVLSVGATNKDNDGKASFSNYGRSVNVFAPGVNLNTTLPRGRYTGSANGTSFASPLAAGIAALVRTRFPEYSPDQAREQIRLTADPIDALNLGFAGLLGRGRINAFRAVTETGFPAIRLVDVEVADSDADGYLESGETVQLTLRFTNHLAPTRNVQIQLLEEVPYVTLTQDNAFFAQLGTGDTVAATFSFEIASNAPQNRQVIFETTIQADAGYTDRDLFRLIINPEQTATLATGRIQTSITTTGNLGWTGFAGEAGGVGFTLDGRNLLFEGGLLVGISERFVSDAVRGEDGVTQHRDFQPTEGGSLEIIAPGRFTAQQGTVELTDQGAPFPLRINVLQETYADTASERQLFVIIHYTIENLRPTPLAPLYAGLFLDWDLNPDARDFARFDAARRLGIVQDKNINPDTLAAIRLLTPTPFSYRAIDNPSELYNGFTQTEKWNALSGGLQQTQLNNTDVSQLMAAGPFRLDPGCRIPIAFAVLAADNANVLAQAADEAQRFWNEVIQPSIPNEPPAFAATPDTLWVQEGEALNWQFTATDPDACPSLIFQVLEGPEGFAVDPLTGEVTFTPAFDQAGIYTLRLLVTDGLATDTMQTTLVVQDVNSPPAFTAVLTDTVLVLGRTFRYQFQAEDPEGDPLTYTLLEAPPGASIDAQSGQFVFTPQEVATYTVVVAVSDGRFTVATPRIRLQVIPASVSIQIYPSPGRSPIYIVYDVPDPEAVRLTIYDLLGRRVQRLVDGRPGIGRHTVTWDGRSEAGVEVAPGLYFVRLEVGKTVKIRPLVYMR